MFGLEKRMLGGETRAYRQEIGSGWGASDISLVPGTASGLAAGTRVATALGWRPVEAIARGDLVLTFDRGMQPVRGITRSIAWADADLPLRALWPLCVPAGALGNAEPMLLTPEQPVMLESDTAEILYGDPFTLVQAADLAGFRGIERIPPQGPVETVMLHFDRDEVAFVADGALAFCGHGRIVGIDELMADAQEGGYHSLAAEEALLLIEAIECEDAVAGAGGPAPDDHMTETAAYAAAFG